MLELPPQLRVPVEVDRLEAGGRRAHAFVREGALHVAVGHGRVVLELDPPPSSGRADAWPFAARSGGDTLFAATDLPVVVLDRAAGSTVRVRPSGSTAPIVLLNGAPVDGAARAEGEARIVVHAADGAAPDADALIAGAVARARKRSVVRPRVTLPGDATDPVGIAEHRLRLALAARAELGARARAVAVLALLAINDAKSALEAIRDGVSELGRDDAAAVVVCGAWSAWRGTALDVPEIGRAASAWRTAADDAAWSRAARAFAPYCGDVLAQGAAAARSGLDPATTILEVVSATPAPRGAADLLDLMHGALGVMPDATRARVRLAPRLAVGSTRIDQLVAGDATIFLAAEVADERAAIEMEQTHGATPFTAILEPWLSAGRLRAALIEDTRAELDSTIEAGGIRPRVQLIIDRRRTVVLSFDRC